ncbi:MAG: 50S ribosomal protein L21 [Phycisphaerae bacterium]|nr:MAG: 50S ribosomal protein L21 [Phycisphaerae bacterium]
MYAIIENGAHQYRVETGTRLDVQLQDIPDDAKSMTFDKVLMVSDGGDVKIGAPYVEGAKVTASIDSEIKGDKITVVKFRRRKNYRRKQGHRQGYLRVFVQKIEA